MSSHRGNSRSHLVRKLKKEGRPDLARAVEAGGVTPFAAAVEMGWRKWSRNLGTGSANAAQRRAARLRKFGVDGRLTGDQLQELWLGPPAGGSAFASDDERRAAWFPAGFHHDVGRPAPDGVVALRSRRPPLSRLRPRALDAV
jgi:hypothetical protein